MISGYQTNHVITTLSSLRNLVDREWPRTLLHYDLTLPARELSPGKVVALLDAAGAPLPCQVDVRATHRDGSIKQCRVSFYSGLKKGETLTFTLVARTAGMTA